MQAVPGVEIEEIAEKTAINGEVCKRG